ncbi:MAG: DUF3823 domain-containing protein [Chitinophagaceae bacterium]
MKKELLILVLILSVLGGCKKDNKEPPKSTLTGVVVVTGTKTPVGVASNGTQLEIWQSGYQLFQKIAVYIDQDGTFSSKLYDGQYKLVRLSGAPWANATDTIVVNLKGSATVEVPVMPFFTTAGETYTYKASDTSITAVFSVNRLDATKNADKVSFHIALTNFVDAQTNQIPIPAATNDIAPAGTYLTAPTTIKILLNPDRYPGTANAELRRQLSQALLKGYGFVRVGVRTTGVTQRYYTQVKEVALK